MRKTAWLNIKSEIYVVWISYLLYLLFVPALLGFVISYIASKLHDKSLGVQMSNMRESHEIIASHYQWLIRTFIFVSAFVMMGIGTSYYGVGYFVATAAIVWWFYRVIKGIVAFAGQRRMPA